MLKSTDQVVQMCISFIGKSVWLLLNCEIVEIIKKFLRMRKKPMLEYEASLITAKRMGKLS